jgi:hypothetical protein
LERFLSRSKDGNDLSRLLETIFELRAKLPDLRQEMQFLEEVAHSYREGQDRKRFESGDVSGLLDCVVACRDFDRPLPAWALGALATAFAADPMGDEPLKVALFGKAKRGRPSDYIANILALAAVFRAEREGYRGHEKFERAQVLLTAHPRGVSVGLDRLRQLRIRKGQEELHRQARLVLLVEFSSDPQRELSDALSASIQADMMRTPGIYRSRDGRFLLDDRPLNGLGRDDKARDPKPQSDQ